MENVYKCTILLIKWNPMTSIDNLPCTPAQIIYKINKETKCPCVCVCVRLYEISIILPVECM